MRGMALVTFLLAAQLGLFGFLFIRAAAVEREITLATEGLQALVERTVRIKALHEGETLHGERDLLPSEPHMREIIREQIDEALARVLTFQPENAEPATEYASATAQELPSLAYERELGAVEQDLDYYIQVSQITKAEMAQLQADIAKLRPSDRTALLSRVVRALNEGTLDGPP